MNDIARNTTYSNKDSDFHKFFPKEELSYPDCYKFQSEEEAEDFMCDAFLHRGFEVNRQVQVKQGSGIIDIVARKEIDGKNLILPIEVKKWFRGPSEISKATFQASDYAKLTGYPVFLGPVFGANQKYFTQINQYLSFMCRLNVGYVIIGSGQSIIVKSDASMPLYSVTYSKFHGRFVEQVKWYKWGFRKTYCSNSKMKLFYKGRYDG